MSLTKKQMGAILGWEETQADFWKHGDGTAVSRIDKTHFVLYDKAKQRIAAYGSLADAWKAHAQLAEGGAK